MQIMKYNINFLYITDNYNEKSHLPATNSQF